MIIKNFSEREYNKLKEFVPNTKFNTEGFLFLVPNKEFWSKKYKLFKRFFVTDGISFSNKLATINTLNDFKNDINIEELVLPDSLISIDYKVEGYLMDYVQGKNFSNIINDSKISLNVKKDILKQIGLVLKKIKEVRSKSNIKDFYITDLHEDNIIVDKEGKIHIIDMDSSKIGGNIPSPSLYLNRLKNKKIFNSKYKIDNYNKEVLSPNEDTDNYCYSIMLLNTLYQDDVSTLDINEFYDYINYLKDIGIDKNLIEIFFNLYTDKKNENCLEYIDYITDKAYQATKKIYTYKKGK